MAAALNIVLTMCLLHGVLSAEFQVFMPDRIEAVAGSCVTIPCSFEIQDAYEYGLDDSCVAIWKKNGMKFSDSVASRFQTTPTRKDLKNKICTSTQRNTEIADSGTYYFRVQCNNGLRNTFPRGVNIAVKADPPKPTLSPSELVVEEGASVTLQCSAPAPCPSLPPNVTWTPTLGPLEQTLMEEQDKTKVLISVVTFTASHLHHGQTFYCTAVYSRPDQSSVSSVSPGLTAHVQYQPKDTRVSVQPSGPVREGTNVDLTCSSDANPPVKMYTWYRPGPEHPTLIHTGPGLTIKVSRNTGGYLCKAENDVGTGWSSQTNIDVQYVPDDPKVMVSPSGPVREGTNVDLTCSSDANPSVKMYTWYRPGPEHPTLIHTGPGLTIEVSRNTGGFLCKAENDVGTGWSSKTNIDVQYAPEDTKVLVSPSDPVREGTNVDLTCSSDANPPVKMYTWYRPGPEHPILIHTGPGLTIEVSRNTGAFLCKAENDVGTGWSSKTNINVQFAPQILSSSNCSHAAATVSCSCYTVGNPSPTLQWYLNGLSANISDNVDISESLNGTNPRSIITVKVLQGLDLPTLLCHSSNSVGSTRRQFRVHSFEDQTGSLGQGQRMLPVFASTVAILLILVCVLLFVIRSVKTRLTLPGAVSMNRLLDENDEGCASPPIKDDLIHISTHGEFNATERTMYAFPNILSPEHESTLGETRNISMLDNAHGDGRSSAEKKQKDAEVIHSGLEEQGGGGGRRW